MELTVHDRLILLRSLIGIMGNIAETRIIRDLKKDLSFTEEEHKKYGIVQTPDGGLRWKDVISTKEIPIGEVAHRIIVERFQELDRQKKVSEDMLPVIDKFPEFIDTETKEET